MPPPPSRRISAGDRVILVMGPTGVGKSTFINTLTGQDGCTVGHDLTSFTTDIKPVVITAKGGPLVIVDTPGFDDTYKSDTEILALIAEWIVKGYRQELTLSGILYLHRINNPRMSGSTLKNLRVFTNICGMEIMSNVVLVTTFWEQIPRDVGRNREEELRTTFWKEMLNDGLGCEMKRFELSHNSAWEIVNCLLSKQPIPITNKNKFSHRWVQVSDEMVDCDKSLNETKVALALAKELEQLIKDQKRATDRLRKLVGQSPNEIAVNALQAEIVEIETKISTTKFQLNSLSVPILKRLRNFIRKWHSTRH